MSWATWIQFPPSHPISPGSILMLSSVFMPSRSKFPPQHTVLKTLSLCPSLKVRDRPSLAPIQHHWQNYSSIYYNLSLGVKRPGRVVDYSPPSSAEVKEWVQLYLHSPLHLHGVVLS
jgi:hypothetical protein